MKLVFTGKGTIEGYTAGWVAKRMLKTDCEWVNVCPGENKLPPLDGKEILMFGVAYHRQTLLYIEKKAKSLQVFDNDPQVRIEIGGMKCVKTNLKQTAALMAWNHLKANFVVRVGKDKKSEFHFMSPPWIVFYTEKKSLWPWPSVNPYLIKIAIQKNYQETLESWDELATRDLLIVEQEGIEAAKKEQTAREQRVEQNEEPNNKKEPENGNDQPERKLEPEQPTRKRTGAHSAKSK